MSKAKSTGTRNWSVNDEDVRIRAEKKARRRISVTENQAYEALRLAQLNEHRGPLASVARVNVVAAKDLFDRGDFFGSWLESLSALRLTVGLFSPIYELVENPAQLKAPWEKSPQ